MKFLLVRVQRYCWVFVSYGVTLTCMKGDNRKLIYMHSVIGIKTKRIIVKLH